MPRFPPFPLLPAHPPAFPVRAKSVAGSMLTTRCPDDSFMNCAKAEEIGWTVVHLVEDDVPALEKQACKHQIKSLQELRDIFPHIFKSRVAVDG